MPGPHPTHRPASPQRRDTLAAFYSAQHRRLAQRLYRSVAGIGPWDVDDACGFAWLQLVRRPDIRLDRGGAAWLTTVAIREARRLTNAPERDEFPDRSDLPSDPLEHALAAETHQQRLQRFARLKPRERRDLLLAAAGHSYREIAAMTGSTYTAVNRRITEGRARLRARI